MHYYLNQEVKRQRVTYLKGVTKLLLEQLHYWNLGGCELSSLNLSSDIVINVQFSNSRGYVSALRGIKLFYRRGDLASGNMSSRLKNLS